MTKAMRTVKKGVIPAAQVFAEARKRPGYAEAYDALEEEFSLVTALIKARTNSGLTQAELAKRMSTTQAVIARLEAGGRRPSTRTLERLAKARPATASRSPSCRKTASPGVERLCNDEAAIATYWGGQPNSGLDPSLLGGAPSPRKRGVGRTAMKFGIFYEQQLPKPWDAGDERAAVPRGAGAGRARRPARAIDYAWEVEHHFLEEYSHSLGARGVPGRRRRAHQAHPARPRHPAGDPQLQPPGAHGRGARHARHHLQRPARVRHRRGRDAARARRLRHPGQGEARAWRSRPPSRSPT